MIGIALPPQQTFLIPGMTDETANKMFYTKFFVIGATYYSMSDFDPQGHRGVLEDVERFLDIKYVPEHVVRKEVNHGT